MSTLLMALRFQLFQLIEWATRFRQNSPESFSQHHIPNDPEGTDTTARYLWVYASTIGELHAIQSLLNDLLSLDTSHRLVILTDHPHYNDAFQKAFSKVKVVDHGLYGDVADQIDKYPPWLFILAEIPCLLSDAPCRFSYRVIHEFKRRNTPVVTVNGWLYGDQPSCRIDAIERSLLHKDYISSIDLFSVQNNEIRNRLIATGVFPDKVVVTGNIKFDALNLDHEPVHIPEALNPLLLLIKESKRPCIVAGCITNVSEQEYVLDAFKMVIEKIPNALLVLAPRHPENTERMVILDQLLHDRDLNFILRSNFEGEKLTKISVIVLDTIGELRHLYAVSKVSFVGLNHNVLEPLSLEKNVLVSSGWGKRYPSYPVYEETKKSGLITETNDSTELAEMLIEYLRQPPGGKPVSIRKKIQSLCGATDENMKLIRKLVAL